MGVLGLSMDDMDLLSVREILQAWQWKQKRERELLEAQLKNQWEVGRLLAAYIIAPYSKQKITDLKSLFSFEWDESAGPKIGTDEWKEQQKEIRRRILAKEAEQHG